MRREGEEANELVGAVTISSVLDAAGPGSDGMPQSTVSLLACLWWLILHRGVPSWDAPVMLAASSPRRAPPSIKYGDGDAGICLHLSAPLLMRSSSSYRG